MRNIKILNKPISLKIKTAENLMKEFDREPSHAIQVSTLALQLFDELSILHGMNQKDRELLEAAALLHDIGWSKGPKGHHKNSMKMILLNELPGWDEKEKLLIANIARYHRKSFPSLKHKNFDKLDKENQEKVKTLASLLRIADGLDRSHTNCVKKIQAELDADCVHLHIFCRGEISAEIYGFEKKSDFFTQTFNINIVVDNITNTWNDI